MRTEQVMSLPPKWAMIVGSIVLIFHLFALSITVLDAPSGLWPVPGGRSMAFPPPFAYHAAEYVTLPYTRLIKMTSSFHFNSNRQENQEILFEAHVKNEAGKIINTYRFPDPAVNPWVRYRQRLLAQQLGNDEQAPPRQAVKLPPAGQQLPKERWWQPDGEKRSKLIEDSPNAIPPSQEIMQPSALSYLVAKSYARYLCRTNNAAKTEIVREWFDPINPGVLLAPEPPTDDAFSRYYASYGDLPK